MKIDNFFLFRFFQRVFFAIVNYFRKEEIRWSIEETKKFPGTIPVSREDPTEREEKYLEEKAKLDECLYGSVVIRKTGYHKGGKMRGMDGWRHNLSHPFYWEGKVYDNLGHVDKNVDQYNELHGRIKARYLDGG